MIKLFFIWLIRLYQLVVSPLLGPCCRFSPSCSAYAITCVQRFGAARGAMLAGRRLLKCHPFGPAGFDPPPGLAKPRGNAMMRKAEN